MIHWNLTSIYAVNVHVARVSFYCISWIEAQHWYMYCKLLFINMQKKWCYVWEKRVKFSWLLTSNQLNANSTSRFFITFSQNYVSCLILIALTNASTPTLCSFVHPKLSKRQSSKIYVTESSLGLQRNRNNLYRRVLLFNLVCIL